MSKPTFGLGRGLDEILPGLSKSDGAEVFRVPVSEIDPNPYQPRLSFDKQELEDLCASIRSLGLIQPITLRRMPAGRYQIISGERRFKACQMAGMTSIPAYVREADNRGMLEMAIVENLQRSDLDPIELALGYQRLIDECSLTQEDLSTRLGKGRATVTNSLRLLKLPPRVQHDLKVGQISTGHAKAILGVEDPALQEQICDVVVRDGLSVRQTESLVRKMQRSDAPVPAPKKEQAASQLPDDYNRLLTSIGRYFSREISLKRGAKGKGTMTIRFSSDEEVRSFVEALEGLNR